MLWPGLGGPELCKPPASTPYRCGRQWGPYRLLSGDTSGSLAPGQQSPFALAGLVFLSLLQLTEAHTPGLVLFPVLPPLRQSYGRFLSVSACASPHLCVEWLVLTKSVTCYLPSAKHIMTTKGSHLLEKKRKRPTSSSRRKWATRQDF